MKPPASAVVLDLSANGISMARTLGRQNIRVYAFDVASKLRKGRTRHATCLECPDPAVDEEGLVEHLIAYVQKAGERPVLYMGSDDYVLCVSRHRTRLAGHYRFLLPAPSLVEALMDKRESHRLACQLRIPTPKTWILEEVDLNAVSAQVRYPCILKPAASHRFRRVVNEKAFLISCPSELFDSYAELSEVGPLMVQEWIPGGDDEIYQVGFFVDALGVMRGRFVGRKLLRVPPRFGSGAVAISETHREVVDLATALVRALGVVGLCNVEFKRDPRNSTFKLMEIDPRPWLWHDLARVSGVDLVSLYYQSLTGDPPEPRLDQVDGVRWVYEVRAALAGWEEVRAGRLTARRLWEYLRGKRCYALFARDDLMPFVRITLSHLTSRRSRPRH